MAPDSKSYTDTPYMTSASSSFRETFWIPRRRLQRSTVPRGALDWLLDQDSLTKRIISACPGKFSVQVLSQRWELPMAHEARALKLDRHNYALVRQVQLMCGDTPWVYARTIIPRQTLSGRLRRLAHLESRSLGAVLFADPSMQRDEVEVACVRAGTALHDIIEQRVLATREVVWGRRSRFHVDNKPLLVSEFFLPVMEDIHF